MPTLDETPDGEDPVRLLIVGDSKSGKSTYAAEAAKAGFNVIYGDSDNGLSALKYALRDDQAAQKRVHYLGIKHPTNFWRGFLRSSKNAKHNWIPETGKLWGKLATGVADDEVVWQFDITAIPKSWIIVNDGWTSVSNDALGIGSADQDAKLLEGVDQSIYGDANVNLTFIANLIQKDPRHWIVQAHATKYEVYDKPMNIAAGQAKQGQSILREIIDTPLSSSRPHGPILATRFNHIGWLSVSGTGETEIDFMRKPNRIGGGPPNKKGSTKSLSFLSLVGGKLPAHEEPGEWFKKTTHAEAKK